MARCEISALITRISMLWCSCAVLMCLTWEPICIAAGGGIRWSPVIGHSIIYYLYDSHMTFFPLRCIFVFFSLSVGWCNTPAIIHVAEVSPMIFLLHLTGVMIWCCVSWLIAVSLKCEHGFFQHRASGPCASYLHWGGQPLRWPGSNKSEELHQ